MSQPGEQAARWHYRWNLWLPRSVDTSAIAAHFKGRTTPKRLADIERLLHTLVAVGRAGEADGKWAAV